MNSPKAKHRCLGRILLLLTTFYLPPMVLAAESLNFNSSTPASRSNGTDSNGMLARFLDAMGRVNNAVLHQPRKNVYEPGARKTADKPAPFLDVDGILSIGKMTTNQTTNSALTKRIFPIWKRFLTNHSSPEMDLSSSLARSYTIPPEILSAAKLAAESSPRVKTLTSGPDGEDDYDAIVRSMIKAGFTANDTNAAPQAMQGPDGLGPAYEKTQGPNPMDVVSSGGNIVSRREGGGFWMEGIQATRHDERLSGFQTWRNVGDYGAKGDGRTDDTQAIQRAVSDGDRCSLNCDAEAVRPVTVYFPAGSYLVSSMISLFPGTEVLGNPDDLPRLVAAPSFVGGALLASSVYTGTQPEWYVDSEDYQQSVRNLVIDIRKSSQKASIAGIHWRACRGGLLDNIHFYATNPVSEPSTTQLGLYVENGSGGVLSRLMFVGGKYGLFTGTQQFTGSDLHFKNCETALYIDRDWGLTMQKTVIDDCDTGVMLGLSGPGNSTIETAGSLILSDTVITNGRIGINISAPSSPSDTSNLIMLNSRLAGLTTAIYSSASSLPGNPSGDMLISTYPPSLSSSLPESPRPRPTPLTHPSPPNQALPKEPFFTRSRPTYSSPGQSEIFNVRTFGARGDGQSDDTPVLNSVLTLAANLSAIVYIPQGTYLVSNTIRVPLGSRVVGQAWPRILGKTGRFEKGKAVVRVGEDGDMGVVEVQGLEIAIEDGGEEAVLMEWNVREGVQQGGAGLWDTKFVVGERFAGLVMHITRKASAYLENVWTSKNVVGGFRGLLVESEGPTWLWGTSFEGSGPYQYRVARADQVLLGGTQTAATTCSQLASIDDGAELAESPAVLSVLDSGSIYILGAAVFPSLSSSQRCQKAASAVQIRQNHNLWLYSLAVIGQGQTSNSSVQMLSSRQVRHNGSTAALSTASFQALLVDTLAAQAADPYQLYQDADFVYSNFTKTCQSALLATINCDAYTQAWTGPEYHGGVDDSTLTTSICAPTCAKSLASWVRGVDSDCAGNAFDDGSPPAVLGNYIWYGWNETCQKDPSTGKYCNDIIAAFPASQGVDNIPKDQLCSDCYLGRLQMMQASRYSAYGTDVFFQKALGLAVKTCGLKNQPTTTQPPVIPPTSSPKPYCVTNKFYTIKAGDNCTTIALANSVSSADLFNANNMNGVSSNMSTCTNLAPPGSTLCLPMTCKTYRLQAADDCDTASWRANVSDIRAYNTFIDAACSNLHSESILGSVLCSSPPGGAFTDPGPANGTTGFPGASTGFGTDFVAPPSGTPVAKGTTTLCGKWYIAVKDITCDEVLTRNGIYMELFLSVNPSIKSSASCSRDLVPGTAYCVAPLRIWATPYVDAGCWKNSGATGVLGDMSTNSTSMTVLKCAEWCIMDQGYPVFGLSKGTSCFCDTALNKGSVQSDGCTTVCGGDSKVKCGGSADVSVFTTGTGVRVRTR
ncbi:pectate lyase superfamily protein-domain-containing protein [Echria macrotheca]|uniref:Pectate lyase superfamily protein-domain-containing protein n=1 Tax=Echria macrotheca TaxID=438768 RepID=A0AAJ0F675_9PEZI|nr:pectate lyase superfamily protein-domain-containing protein [Echria macrotheca]